MPLEPRRQTVGQELGRAQREEHAGREHGIDEPERVSQHDPAGPVAALGDELVVGVGRHLRHALGVAGDGEEPGIGLDGALEPLLRSAPELGRVGLIQHDPDGETILKRDAPGPAAGLTARDEHLARHVVPAEVLEMGEMRDVLPRSELGADRQRARPLAGAAGGVDDEVRGMLVHARRGGQRLGRERQLGARPVTVAGLEAGSDRDVAHAGGERLGEQRLVEARARDVVGVRKHGRHEAIERHADPVGGRPDERDAGLDPAEAGRLLFEAELSQDRHDSGDERFPDEQGRVAAVVEERDVASRSGEQDRERRARRTRPDDRNPQTRGRLIRIHGVLVHPIPSRITSMIRAASVSVMAPSSHDTTMLSRFSQRLKNTPSAGRGGTIGT